MGRHIKQLVGVNTGAGRSRHVPNGITTGFFQGNTRVFEFGPELGRVGEFYKVKLDILPGGGVEVSGGVFVGDIGNANQLIGGNATVGQFNANHLHTCLPLTIHTPR